MLCQCLHSHALKLSFVFFNDTATTEIYTLSLHDALPISQRRLRQLLDRVREVRDLVHRTHRVRHLVVDEGVDLGLHVRSEEHTSELQSQSNLVCRLLLEKKKQNEAPLQAENASNAKSVH